MGLQGVVTTGIYCRAECTAKPASKNVRKVRSAVEAQAKGFRPCLRCRPDRLPGLGIEQPAAEIAHAVQLISDGFLDDATTDALAARIGYSTRHLVRLFEEHIGASPDFVARSRRGHLARRLLDDTNLSITHIAFAAGFQSARQMNRTMRALFGFAPTALRAKRLRADAALAEQTGTNGALDGGLRLRLPYSPPFDAHGMVAYLGSRAIPGVEILEDDTYRRTMVTCGYPGVVDVRDTGDGTHLEVTMHLATFGSIVDQVERVRALLGIRHDSSRAERTLRKDKLLGPLVRRTPGVRLAGAFDRFETAVRVIVGQQVSVAGASTVTGRIASRFGTPIDAALPGGLRYVFPSPETLAGADLKDIGMPGARARTIVAFAKAVAHGDIDLSATKPLDETTADLEAIAGIGPWTSNLIAARAMGHADAFPASDLGLRKGAAALLGKKTPLSANDTAELAERWRPYRTTAMAYLWRHAA